MKTTEMAKKTAYIGAGAGIVLFALIGLLPGSFLGGVIGLNIAGRLVGLPLSSDLLPRVIVALSMLGGILVSGIVFITGLTFMGWLIGYTIDSVRSKKGVEAEVKIK